MTIAELLRILETYPPEATVEVQFDVNDHDTTWELAPYVRTNLAGVVVLVAK